MSDFFCSLPWTGIDISPQGGFKPCCKYSQTISRDLQEYLDSQHLKLLQQEFLDGKKPIGCKRCWDDEAAGLPSKRQLDHRYSFDNQTPELDSWKIMSFSFGNTCNLACVPCGSASSSRWAQDEKKLQNRGLFTERIIHNHEQFYRDWDFLDNLLSRCDDLIHLDIPGGEPFFADSAIHKKFLSSLKHPEKIKIHYTTNGTVFPDNDFWNLWKKFRKIDIQLSIDGIESKFEYLRYPAKWKVLMENIDRYKDSLDCIQLSISHTVSWVNLLYLDDFINWCKDHDLPRPYIGMVSAPRYLNPKALPEQVKKQIREMSNSGKLEIQQCLDYMDSENLEAEFEKGIKWLKSLDQIRKTDFSQTFPKLQKIIQNC